ncbi:MAG: hypothetical protein HY925_07815 [Elusimicrobia bacterium]|nr:hypothetical protein [Elusimicrobiota bacterium]
MVRPFAISRLILAALISPPLLFAGEQAGPNPSNLTPTGTQGVSLFTGAFTYSYPLVVPPGRREFQPDLTLTYNSQAQNGWLGLGWDLGVGNIRRSTRNGMPTYDDSQDTFVLQLNGATQDLVRVGTGTVNGNDYAEYRAQIESSFSRIRYFLPNFWQVTGKDGMQYEFQGQGLNVASGYFFWGMTKKFDPLGNFMQVSYPNLASATISGAPGPGGEPTAIVTTGALVGFMPASIGYTGKCTPTTCLSILESTSTEITFLYEMRPDVLDSWILGAEQKVTTRLKK